MKYIIFLVFADDGLSPEISPINSPFGVVKNFKYIIIFILKFGPIK